jgi:hypothetical protein
MAFGVKAKGVEAVGSGEGGEEAHAWEEGMRSVAMEEDERAGRLCGDMRQGACPHEELFPAVSAPEGEAPVREGGAFLWFVLHPNAPAVSHLSFTPSKYVSHVCQRHSVN